MCVYAHTHMLVNTTTCWNSNSTAMEQRVGMTKELYKNTAIQQLNHELFVSIRSVGISKLV